MERELAGVQHKMIERANQSKDPFEKIADEFKTFKTSQNEVFDIKFKNKKDFDSKAVKWAMKLTERNVRSYYESSKMGWVSKIKQTALNKPWSRYLIAYEQESKTPVAFCMFRFDMDYGRSVIYCYEMQVDFNYQRKGLGGFMMEALESLAKVWSMERVVLTLLINNEAAMPFYSRLGYTIDETSPEKSDNEDYEIWSKVLIAS